MRLLDLHIKRYGHFADQHFDLEGDGVRLLVGPNEAGKTTLLEFIREMLFGFAERNVYDFGEGRIEGEATMRLSSGQMVELRRHKGRKRTVDVRIDGHETEHDAQSFLTLLDDATPSLFRSVFAFGLQELAEADKSLGESVRTALYGGGLANIGNPKRILDVLNGEAAKLFQERAKNPAINALCSELKDLAKQVRDKSIRCEAYHTARAQLDEAEQESRRVAEHRQELYRAHSHTKRLLKAFPGWTELCAYERERGTVTAPDGFPATASQEFALEAETIKRNEAEQQRLLAEIESAQQALKLLALDPALLNERLAIEHAHQMLQSVAEARRDLPLRQVELDNARQSIQHELSDLVPGWGLEQLSRFTFDAARESALDAFAADRKGLDRRKTELQTQQSGVRNELQKVAAELAAVPDVEDVSALRELLERREAYNNQHRDLARLQEARAANQHATEALAILLNPPLAATAGAHELPVPPKETFARFKHQYALHEQRVNAAEGSLAEDLARLDTLEKELAALDGGSELLPTRDSMSRMRARRDAGWSLVRKKYIAGEDADSAVASWLAGGNLVLADAYEEAVREADHYSDVILARSSAVAKQEQVEAARRRLEEKRQAFAELQSAGEKLDGQWHAQWAACGFVPLDVDAMESWLRNHAKLRELVLEGANQAAAIRALQERVAAFESAVREAVGGKDQGCAALLATAKSRVQHAEATERQRQILLKSRRELQIAAGRVADDLAEHDKQEDESQTRWTVFLTEIGLPAQWSVALAQKVIARLTTAREKLHNLPGLEARIEQMRQRLREFTALFTQICQAAAQDYADELPEIGVGRLHESLTAAVQSQERHASLMKALDEKRRRLLEVEKELTAAQARRERLLRLAEVDNEGDFRQVAERAAKIAELDAAIARQRREFDKDRENEDHDEFTQELRKADIDALRQQERELADQLAETERKTRLADERVGSCRQVLLELEKGSSEAATLQEQLAGKRARLAAEVDRYVPLIFAQRLLERAIKRFEQESQPAMLKEVSNIFASMTGGRYVRVQKSNDEEGTLLALRADGKPLEPHELSTGTREQLYLAIRLAYVLHYCSRAEPLPIVMDDVLANFDDARALQTLQALGEVAQRVQVLMFTCHPHLVSLAQTAFVGLDPIEIAAGQGACV